MRRFLISAGEPSGDHHAAAVAHALRRLESDVEIDAVGGESLATAGATMLAGIEHLSAVGTIESARTLPHHLNLLRKLDHALRAGRYDALLVVDYPGFHLQLIRRAAAHGVPVVYYIAPQLWAWGAWRAAGLRSAVRHLAVVLPFEEPYFSERGVPSTFVGHPLLDRDPPPTRAEARALLGMDDQALVLAVFPGSRRSERERMWPVFRDACRLLHRDWPDMRVVVAAPGACCRDLPGARGIENSKAVLAAADAVLCKSGTTTLEAVLADTPMVVSYRLHPVTFALARRLVRIPHVSLANLVAGEPVVPELLQDHATPLSLANALRPLLKADSPEGRAQRQAFVRIRERLGSPGAARRVAALTLQAAA